MEVGVVNVWIESSSSKQRLVVSYHTALHLPSNVSQLIGLIDADILLKVSFIPSRPSFLGASLFFVTFLCFDSVLLYAKRVTSCDGF